MAEVEEELEPLFDYSRVQPLNFVSLDDDDSTEFTPIISKKGSKISNTVVEEKTVVDCEAKDEEDWLAPPPQLLATKHKLEDDSTIKELRLKKQELVSFTQSAADVVRAVEESMKREFSKSLQSSMEHAAKADDKLKPPSERAKIVISVQDKGGLKQFRVFVDDKFERLFKMYADKVKLDKQCLVFSFDGDRISPTATPDSLGMEDNDIIEVHVKSS